MKWPTYIICSGNRSRYAKIRSKYDEARLNIRSPNNITNNGHRNGTHVQTKRALARLIRSDSCWLCKDLSRSGLQHPNCSALWRLQASHSSRGPHRRIALLVHKHVKSTTLNETHTFTTNVDAPQANGRQSNYGICNLILRIQSPIPRQIE